MSLYNKYRPQTLAEMKGNTALISAIKFYNKVVPKYKIAYPKARYNMFKTGTHELIAATE